MTSPADLALLLPLSLRLRGREVATSGLIDTGAAIGVMPWSVGAELGADWDAATPVDLTGNLGQAEARMVVCEASVGEFLPRRLLFAWSRSNTVPVILGRVNFLMEFDLIASRSGGWFEIADPGQL